jgi:DNA polymerase III epsilon subunit-like protein
VTQPVNYRTRQFTMPLNPVFYDCEASALDGYPIETGWVYIAEGTETLVSEGYLVRPTSDWTLHGHWDPRAEALHGITPEQLSAQGRPPQQVAQQMNRVLASRELFSDSALDEAWLRQVFDEAGLEPAFTIRRFDAIRLIVQLAAGRGITKGRFASAQREAQRLAPRTHRAEPDARHLATLWHIVSMRTPRRKW